MSGKKINRLQAEKILEEKYLMKYVEFTAVGYKPIVGRVDRVFIDIIKGEPLISMMINDKKYSCSIESRRDCIKLLKKG